MSVKTKGLIFLFLLSFIWGASFPLMEVTDKTLPPLTMTLIRCVVGAIVLYAFLRFRGSDMPRIGREWIPFVVMGVFGVLVVVAFQAYSEEHISGGFAAILSSTTPVFTIVIAYVFADEILTVSKLAGVFLGLIGALIILAPGLEAGAKAAAVGVIMILISVLSRSTSSVYARRSLKQIDPLQSAVGMLTTAALVLIPLSLLVDHPLTLSPSFEGMAYTILLGIFASALANLLLFWLIANRGATFSSLYACIEPAIAVLIGVIFLGDTIQVTTIVGMVVVAVSIAIINGYLGTGKVISQGHGGI